MAVRKTSVAIDEDLLAAARDALHTATVRETVEQALIEVLRARARREDVEALSEQHGMDLGNPKVMSRVWRR